MSGKKLKIMSLSIEPETQDFLKEKAKIEGISVSNLVRDLVEKYLRNRDKITIVEHSEDYIPVVLRIPSRLRGDEKVKEWLRVRTDAIAAKLLEKKSP